MHLRKRGNLWRVDVRYKGSRISKSFTKKGLATTWANKTLAQLEAGTYQDTDKLLDHYRASNERLMESNLRLQRCNGQLLKTNEDQFDNFKLVAQQAIQMWHKMEESGQFEDFLEEKINLNTEQLMKDVDGKTEH